MGVAFCIKWVWIFFSLQHFCCELFPVCNTFASNGFELFSVCNTFASNDFELFSVFNTFCCELFPVCITFATCGFGIVFSLKHFLDGINWIPSQVEWDGFQSVVFVFRMRHLCFLETIILVRVKWHCVLGIWGIFCTLVYAVGTLVTMSWLACEKLKNWVWPVDKFPYAPFFVHKMDPEASLSLSPLPPSPLLCPIWILETVQGYIWVSRAAGHQACELLPLG